MKLALLFAAFVAVTALTALGAFVGWAMSHSILPPWGGGWRCYVGCIAIVYAPLVCGAAMAGLLAFCRRIARAHSA